MSFLETVEKAPAFLEPNALLEAFRALQRGFNLDGDALDALIAQLADSAKPLLTEHTAKLVEGYFAPKDVGGTRVSNRRTSGLLYVR